MTGRNSYQVKDVLAVLCEFVTLILDENSVKGLRVTKIVKEIKFEGDCQETEAKFCFQRLPEKISFEFYVFIKSSNL